MAFKKKDDSMSTGTPIIHMPKRPTNPHEPAYSKKGSYQFFNVSQLITNAMADTAVKSYSFSVTWKNGVPKVTKKIRSNCEIVLKALSATLPPWLCPITTITVSFASKSRDSSAASLAAACARSNTAFEPDHKNAVISAREPSN